MYSVKSTGAKLLTNNELHFFKIFIHCLHEKGFGMRFLTNAQEGIVTRKRLVTTALNDINNYYSQINSKFAYLHELVGTDGQYSKKTHQHPP